MTAQDSALPLIDYGLPPRGQFQILGGDVRWTRSTIFKQRGYHL